MMTLLDNQQLRVPSHLQGLRIDSVLAELIPAYSRSQLSQWLKQGKITVNQRLLKPKDKVVGGEVIEFHVDVLNLGHQSQALPEAIDLTIVYEDEHLLVINKPAGLVVHPGAGNPNHTLVNALLHHEPALQQLPRAGIIHRLDKDTTGLLVVAKTLASQTSLVRQMHERLIDRRYLALVQGHLISGGEIDTFYGRHPRNRLKMAVCENGRQAITRYFLHHHYQDFTLLNVQLLTGRTHQIRVHLAHIKHPIVGDPLYGSRMRLPREASDDLVNTLQHFKRQALHAITLSFSHPVSHEKIVCHAPIPPDFQQLLDLLDEHYHD